MITQKTPSGIGYLEHYNGPDKPLKIYLHGDGESGNGESDLQKIMRVAFCSKFFNANKDRFNFLIPQYPAGVHGWGKLGVEFWNFAGSNYKYDGREYISGHSAGGKGVMYLLSTLNSAGQKLPTAAAVVAGEADYKATLPLVGKIPVKLFVGDRDTTITTQDKRTILQKMQSLQTWLKTPAADYREYPGVGHGSDSKAYDAAEGLADWFLSKGTAVVPPEIRVDIPGTKFYLRDGKIVFEFENGVKKELTPD